MKKVFGLCTFICIIAGIFLFLQNPYEIAREQRLLGPSLQHWMGTDYLGRDLFSRLMYGTAYSLGYACLSMIAIVCVSLLLGGLAGSIGGLVDTVITTFADIIVSIIYIKGLCVRKKNNDGTSAHPNKRICGKRD